MPVVRPSASPVISGVTVPADADRPDFFIRMSQVLDGLYCSVYFEEHTSHCHVEGNIRPCGQVLIVESADEDDLRAVTIPFDKVRQIDVQ